jgi:putative ABC transport system permease protein
MPVDAITTSHRSARSGLAPLLRRLPWPVSAFRRMPLGNVLRTPRRTVLTALGIGAAITTLVVTFGLLDSFVATMDRNEAELLGEHPERVAVSLGGFALEGGPEISAVEAAETVGRVEPVLRLGASVSAPGEEALEVVVEVLDLDSDLWAPTLEQGSLGPDRSGIVVARKAAEDLSVQVGDTVTVEHPAMVGGAIAVVTTPMVVTGIHPSPFRFFAYLDRTQLDRFGVPGVANALNVLPAPGATADDVEQELFRMQGVTSVQPVAVTARLVEDSLEDFTAIFQVLQVFILFLAVLIAYNATSINADERARERATLFAFGLRLRRVVGLETAEGLLIGLLGTAAGVGVGLLVVRWIVLGTVRTTMPDMGIDVVISGATVVTAVVLGGLAVAIAPLLTVRRLRRMDIPGTLRVVE